MSIAVSRVVDGIFPRRDMASTVLYVKKSVSLNG